MRFYSHNLAISTQIILEKHIEFWNHLLCWGFYCVRVNWINWIPLRLIHFCIAFTRWVWCDQTIRSERDWAALSLMYISFEWFKSTNMLFKVIIIIYLKEIASVFEHRNRKQNEENNKAIHFIRYTQNTLISTINNKFYFLFNA